MKFEDFVMKIAEQYDDIAPENLTVNTKFREVGNYSSLTALLFLTMIDEEYGVTITGDDMRSIFTLGELFDFVRSHV